VDIIQTTLPDIFQEIVSEMEYTSEIAGVSAVSDGLYVITLADNSKFVQYAEIWDGISRSVPIAISGFSSVATVQGGSLVAPFPFEPAAGQTVSLSINYLFGHRQEVSEIEVQKSLTGSQVHAMFPLVWLVLNTTRKYTKKQTDAIGSECTFSIILCDITPNFANRRANQAKAKDRFLNTIKPILIPLANRLLRAMKESGWFVSVGVASNPFNFDLTELPYFGSINQGKGNVFSRVTDAVMLDFQDITIRNKRSCPR